MKDVNIFALGGQDENGKNSMVIETNKDIFVVNAGIKIPINNSNGIDGIIPDFEYLVKHKNKLRGIFITHAHDEAFAALPWLIMDVPGIKIYASEYTAEIIKDRVSKYKLGHDDWEIIILKDEQKIGDSIVKSFDVATAVPGAKCFNIKTEQGDVIVMGPNALGDLGPFGSTDLEKIKSNSGEVLALILDSRLANFKGHSFEKKSVVPAIKEFFDRAGANERIIVGAYDEQVFSIHELILMAKQAGRPVISYGRAFDNLYSNLKKFNDIDVSDFEDYKNSNKIDNAVILVTGTWSRLYQRFVRIATDNDVFLKFKENDNIIMMAPPINGMEVEYADSMDDVAKKSPNILDVSDKDFYQLRSSEEDIKTIVKTLNPKFFLPMNALYRYLVVAAKAATKEKITQDKTIVLPNGRIAHFMNKDLASQKGYIKHFGDVIIDGFGVGDVSYEVIKERQALAAGGLVSIALQLDRKTKKPKGDINIQILGVVTKDNLNDAQEIVKNVILQKMNEAEEFDYREVQNQIRKRTRKVLQREYDKEPLVVVTFLEV